MSDSDNKSFDFDLTLDKAYKAEDGKMHVVGVASDDDIDLTGDQMHEKALESMASQAKKNKLPLIDSHHGTFGFGHTHDAWMQKKSGKREYLVDFELDERYPQAVDLYKEVSSGTCKKQLSIGGHINRADPEAIEHAVDKKSGRYARVIKKITLDHIATTRPKRAAVPGARFIDAIMKSVFDDDKPSPSNGIQTEANVAGVVPFNKHALDQGSSWSFSVSDGEALVAKGGWELFKAAHGWFDAAIGAEKQAAYKLPHHKVVNGEMKTFRRGVIASMIRQHATSIPLIEKSKVRDHLAQHYKEFGMEVPDEKHFTSTEAVIKFHEDQGIDMGWFREEEGVLEKAKLQAQAALSGKEAAQEQETIMADVAVNKTNTKDAERGLDVLARIGNLFGGKPQESTTPLPEHLQALNKAIDGVIAKGVDGAHVADVTKMMMAMNKFLSGAGVKMLDDEAANKSGPAFTKELGEFINKALDERGSSLTKEIGLVTEAMAKGMTDLAVGVNSKLESVQKSVDERVAKLEKLSGVRQSIPGQDTEINKTAGEQPTGEQTGKRVPTKDNPWTGMFDVVRKQALAQMGSAAARK